MGTETHIQERIARAVLDEVRAALPDLKGYFLERSPDEPLQDYEVPSATLYIGREVEGTPNDTRARLPSNVVVRMSRFILVLTVRSTSQAPFHLLGLAHTAQKRLYGRGQTLGGLVERLEHAEAETVHVLEGDMYTSQRFISFNAVGLGYGDEPGFGHADVLAELTG